MEWGKTVSQMFEQQLVAWEGCEVDRIVDGTRSAIMDPQIPDSSQHSWFHQPQLQLKLPSKRQVNLGPTR